MKNVILLSFFLLGATCCFGQNLIINGDFEADGMVADTTPLPWGGFKNRILRDTVIQSFVGQVENGDGSIFQEFEVTPGETYAVHFDYYWVNTAAANSNLTMRVKNAAMLSTNLDLIGGTIANGYKLNSDVEMWFSSDTIKFVVPDGITSVRLLFFKGQGNKPLNLDNIVVTREIPTSVANLRAFDFNAFPNPANSVVNLRAEKNIDRVEVYDLSGRKLLERFPNARQVEIDIRTIPRGLYVVKTHIGEAIGSYRLVKK